MTITETPTTLAVCVDCLFLLANGTVSDDQDPTADAEHAARMDAIWPDAEITLGTVDEDTDDEDGHFSWSSCDGCGSTLGGDRYPATAWTRDAGSASLLLLAGVPLVVLIVWWAASLLGSVAGVVGGVQ